MIELWCAIVLGLITIATCVWCSFKRHNQKSHRTEYKEDFDTLKCDIKTLYHKIERIDEGVRCISIEMGENASDLIRHISNINSEILRINARFYDISKGLWTTSNPFPFKVGDAVLYRKQTAAGIVAVPMVVESFTCTDRNGDGMFRWSAIVSEAKDPNSRDSVDIKYLTKRNKK